ncbi:UNVERIFIED_CONTAM: hypothetical protein FKN15_045164 [Acipenser sinensis]
MRSVKELRRSGYFCVRSLREMLLFVHPFVLKQQVSSKTIQVRVIDDEEYEKNKNFYIELADPRMVDMSFQKGAVAAPSLAPRLTLL